MRLWISVKIGSTPTASTLLHLLDEPVAPSFLRAVDLAVHAVPRQAAVFVPANRPVDRRGAACHEVVDALGMGRKEADDAACGLHAADARLPTDIFRRLGDALDCVALGPS